MKKKWHKYIKNMQLSSEVQQLFVEEQLLGRFVILDLFNEIKNVKLNVYNIEFLGEEQKICLSDHCKEWHNNTSSGMLRTDLLYRLNIIDADNSTSHIYIIIELKGRTAHLGAYEQAKQYREKMFLGEYEKYDNTVKNGSLSIIFAPEISNPLKKKIAETNEAVYGYSIKENKIYGRKGD